MNKESYIQTESYNAPYYAYVKTSFRVYPNYDISWGLPKMMKDDDVSFDLRAAINEDVVLKPLSTFIAPLGLGIDLPPGFHLEIVSRGGLAITHGIVVLNSPSIISPGFKGEIRVILMNLGKEDYVIRRGDRIAQGIIRQSISMVLD